jgi:hypothetical protein
MADVADPSQLNPQRRHRSYPRVVKRARHNQYRVKKPTDAGRRHHGPATVRLALLTPHPSPHNQAQYPGQHLDLAA